MTDEELRRLFEVLRTENAEAHAKTREYVDRSAVETRAYVDQKTTETQREFHITAEGMRSEFQLVAEAVVNLEEKLDREVGALHEKMDRGFAETQAMIRFSHAELDRRIRALEQGFADLQSRIERLETTTH